MDDSFKFSQVTKTLLSILEDEVTECPEQESPLIEVSLESLDKDLVSDEMIEPLKRKLVFDALEQCFNVYKQNEWAKSSL